MKAMDEIEKVKATDSREEVKKLQDLVRKLELQNQQLRSRQKQRNNNNQETNCSSNLSNNCTRNNVESGEEDDDVREEDEEKGNASQSSLLDQVDLIDVEVLDLSDEDSWLYASPEKLTEEQKAISPYKWLSSDVEDPQNRELQSVKRALVSKIEDLTRASFARQNNCLTPSSSVTKLTNRSLPSDDNSEPRIRLPLNARLSLCPSLQKEIDSRTFTRPKKSLKAFELPIVDCEREIDRLKLSSTPPPNPLPPPPITDVSDIHTIARLQEEYLRQSSPPSTPRRSSVASSSSQRSGLSPVTASDHDSLTNNVMQTSAGTDSFHDGSPRAMSSRASSTSASPPVSPHGSQYLDESRCSAYGGVGKRILPNLPKPAFNGLYSSRGPRISQSPQRPHANSNCDVVIPRGDQALRNHRYSLSPARRSIGSGGTCTPRSSSPAAAVVRNGPVVEGGSPLKGGLASRIPKPRTRSAIPTRASRIHMGSTEESWKDGCY